MAQTVLITLTTAGTDSGPFSLYSNIDGFTVAFESSVAKLDLEAGYVSVVVPDDTIIIRVQSMGVICTNYIDLAVITTTTTSSSSTSTTTSSTSTTTSTTTTMAPLVLINILSNTSTDVCVALLGVLAVNGITTTYVSGDTASCPGSGGGVYSTNQIGTFTISTTTDSSVGGATILLTDSDLVVHCQDVPAIIGASVTFLGVAVNTSNPINITIQDGVC